MQKKLLAILICTSLNTAYADELDSIIVTATRSEIQTSEAPSSVTVISNEEIQQKGATNVLDIIRGTTGISIQGIGTGGRKGVSLRGMGSKHTLILIDGKRVPASNDSIGPNTDYQYDWVSTQDIERIEVVRGPMSVLYGADALGGVINIITKKTSKELQGTVKLISRHTKDENLHNGDGHDAEVSLSGSVSDSVRFKFDAQQARRSSLESIINKGESALEGQKQQQFGLGLEWQAAKEHSVEFNITQGQEDRWYDTTTRTGLLYQSQYDISRDQASLTWKGNMGGFANSLQVYQSTIDISNKATNGVNPTSPQKLTDTSASGSTSFLVGEQQVITAGFEHRVENLESASLTSGEDETTLSSLYVQDEIDLSEDLLLTVGARLDDHDVFGNELSPRASLVWNINPKTTLRGSFGHGFRAPNIKQASEDYLFALGTIKVTGNPDLEPETNNAVELGVNYRAKTFSVDAAIFDNKVKNLIELTGPITDRTYANINEARLKGLELSGDINLKKDFSLQASYQYLDAKDGDSNRLKHRPKHTLSSGIVWQKNTWKASLNGEYLSTQIIEHNRVSTEVPSYTIWNMNIQKTINKHFDIAAGIHNLTDVRLEEESEAFLHEEYPRTLKIELRGHF